MKKIIVFIFVLFTCVFLFGCGTSSFKSEYRKMERTLNKSEQVVLDMKATAKLHHGKSVVTSTSRTEKTYVNADPFYIEIKGLSGPHLLYTIIGDNLYEHTVLNNEAAQTRLYAPISSLEGQELSDSLKLGFDPKKASYKMEDDYYVFNGLSPKGEKYSHDKFKEWLDEFDINYGTITGGSIVAKFKFDKGHYYISSEVNVNYLDDTFLLNSYRLEYKLECEIKIEEFKVKDLSKITYICDKITDIASYTELDQPCNNYSIKNSYYKLHLKNGYYYIDRTGNYTEMYMTIFDSTENAVEIDYLVNQVSKMYKQGCIFYIKDEGDYYFRISNSAEIFYFRNFDISNFKEEELEYEKEIKITLDLDDFRVINIQEPCNLNVENTGNNDIKILCGSQEYLIPVGTKQVISTGLGVHSLVIVNSGDQSEEYKFVITNK